MLRERMRLRGKSFVTPQIMISERLTAVEDQAVPGHYEGEFVLGLDSTAIGTLVERTTGYTMLLHLPPMAGYRPQPREKRSPALAGHGAKAVRDAITRAMARLPKSLKTEVLVHSDQGSQFTSDDWQDYLTEHGLKASMSRRGNCHDNAVAESFFQLLKRERIRRKTCDTRDAARRDVFEYIELFYNPKRRHSASGAMSPVDFERQHFNRLATVWRSRDDSSARSAAGRRADEAALPTAFTEPGTRCPSSRHRTRLALSVSSPPHEMRNVRLVRSSALRTAIAVSSVAGGWPSAAVVIAWKSRHMARDSLSRSGCSASLPWTRAAIGSGIGPSSKSTPSANRRKDTPVGSARSRMLRDSHVYRCAGPRGRAEAAAFKACKSGGARISQGGTSFEWSPGACGTRFSAIVSASDSPSASTQARPLAGPRVADVRKALTNPPLVN
jgi:putative transposase